MVRNGNVKITIWFLIICINLGAYKNGVSPDGFILSDHMTLASVVATILILDNTAQVSF